MSSAKIAALISSSESWKSKLADMQEENIHFKMCLAHMLASAPYKADMPSLEYFQSQFLNLDEGISLLRHEVGEQLRQLQLSSNASDLHLKLIEEDNRKLESKMNTLYRNFKKISTAFNNYMSDKTASR